MQGVTCVPAIVPLPELIRTLARKPGTAEAESQGPSGGGGVSCSPWTVLVQVFVEIGAFVSKTIAAELVTWVPGLASPRT